MSILQKTWSFSKEPQTRLVFSFSLHWHTKNHRKGAWFFWYQTDKIITRRWDHRWHFDPSSQRHWNRFSDWFFVLIHAIKMNSNYNKQNCTNHSGKFDFRMAEKQILFPICILLVLNNIEQRSIPHNWWTFSKWVIIPKNGHIFTFAI